MGRLRARASLIAASGFAAVGLPGAVAAHHPGGRDEGGPWFLLALLVLALAFVAFWTVSSFLERRGERPSDESHQREERE
jgi:membrane protein implicated in regulation of membrane protease activity